MNNLTQIIMAKLASSDGKVLVSIFLHYDERVGKRPIRGKELIEEMEKKD